MTQARNIALALILVLLPSAALAQRVVHRVRFGDTYRSVSERYYGTRDHAELLANVNGQRATSKLQAGKRLRIPTSWYYTTTRKRSINYLAKRLLGSWTGRAALIKFNKLNPRKKVRSGKTLRVPYVLQHKLRAGETLLSLAKRYYGDTESTELLSKFNGLGERSPQTGETLKIPLIKLRIRAVRLQRLVNQRLLGVEARNADRKREALREANAMLRRGNFHNVPLRLIRLLAQDQFSDSYMAEVFKLIAVAYVALGQHDLAVQAFREALLRRPDLAPDPVRTSPKVVKAYVDAKNQPTP